MLASISTDKIIETIPHPTFTPIIGQPTYESIAELHLKLNSNAASAHSNRSNGQLVLLFLTIKPEVHSTLSNVPFAPPSNPGPNATIQTGSTGLQISDIKRRHTEHYAEWIRYDQTEKLFKKLLLAAADETYVRSLRNKYVGYANVNILTTLNHLYNSCAKITPRDLKENDSSFHAPYNPNETMEILIDQIEKAIDYDAVGNSPYTAK